MTLTDKHLTILGRLVAGPGHLGASGVTTALKCAGLIETDRAGTMRHHGSRGIDTYRLTDAGRAAVAA